MALCYCTCTTLRVLRRLKATDLAVLLLRNERHCVHRAKGTPPAVRRNKYETSISSLCARHVFMSLHTHREPNITHFKSIPVSAYFKTCMTASSDPTLGQKSVSFHHRQLSYPQHNPPPLKHVNSSKGCSPCRRNKTEHPMQSRKGC